LPLPPWRLPGNTFPPFSCGPGESVIIRCARGKIKTAQIYIAIRQWIAMEPVEMLGFLAMASINIGLLPQVAKSWKTKSTKDISITWNSFYFAGLMLWLAYGVLMGSMPLILSSALEGSLVASLLVLKLKYG
jgi:MtN3 and saliva related transmembrane protein